MKQVVIIINSEDNVAVALRDIEEGSTIALPDGSSIVARSAIPYSHKVALKDIADGEVVVKYGERIGNAAGDLRPGDWVHTHNMKFEGIRH